MTSPGASHAPGRVHYEGRAYTLKAQPAEPLFDDTMDWWCSSDEYGTG